jgi:hypothetical protein
VLVAAADSDPDLREVLEGIEARRLRGLGGLASQLAEAAPCVQICRSTTHAASSGHCVRRPVTIYWFNNGAGLRRPTNTGLRPLCSESCSMIPSRTDAGSSEADLDGLGFRLSEKLASDFEGTPLTTGGHHNR